MHVKKRYLLIIFICLSLPSLAFAFREFKVIHIQDQEGKQVGLYKESHALLIGISEYNNGWPKLPGVKKDIQLVKRILVKHGFNIVTVNDPDNEQLNKAFKDFIDKYGRKPDNRLLLYYAGHGYTKKMSYGREMGYIVPVDAPNPETDITGFMNRAMEMQQIEVFAKRIESKHALFLFDSCFSGSLFALSRAIPKSISYKTSKPVRQFITAGSAEEIVPDKSTFREQFVAALEGEGDVNKDGYLTGTELGIFLQDTVINYTRGSQHPQYGKIVDAKLDKGDFVFILKKEEHSTPDVTLPLTPGEVKKLDLDGMEGQRRIRQEGVTKNNSPTQIPSNLPMNTGDMVRMKLRQLGVGWSAKSFVRAIVDGDLRSVDLFLEGGMDPALNYKGASVVLYALQPGANNKPGVLDLFLKHGFNPNKNLTDVRIMRRFGRLVPPHWEHKLTPEGYGAWNKSFAGPADYWIAIISSHGTSAQAKDYFELLERLSRGGATFEISLAFLKSVEPYYNEFPAYWDIRNQMEMLAKVKVTRRTDKKR